uniref:Placenta-specific gene 8 protein n=1 Tax=Sus scrofa TaxID=9823 RepID=A0A4X1TJ12_PIG
MQAQAPVVIVTQPGGGSIPQTSNWQTGLCDCFSDCGICLCGIFCFSCLAVQVASDLNECCLCGTSVAMRTLYRTRYGIPGTGNDAGYTTGSKRHTIPRKLSLQTETDIPTNSYRNGNNDD